MAAAATMVSRDKARTRDPMSRRYPAGPAAEATGPCRENRYCVYLFFGPLPTVRLTRLPFGSRLPARGLCLSTWFLSLRLENFRVMCPTRQCARTIRVRALASVLCTTFGTTQGGLNGGGGGGGARVPSEASVGVVGVVALEAPAPTSS